MSKKRISKAFSLWFQFSRKDTKKLKKIKSIVNQNFKGPKFDIHLTLLSSIKKIGKKELNLIKKITKKINTFNINLIKYGYTKNIYTSLFIKVRKSKKLISIRDKFKKTNYLTLSSIYNPHISLFYGLKKNKYKKKLISKLPKYNKSVTVDKLCIVDVNEKINKWKIVKKIKLNEKKL